MKIFGANYEPENYYPISETLKDLQFPANTVIIGGEGKGKLFLQSIKDVGYESDGIEDAILVAITDLPIELDKSLHNLGVLPLDVSKVVKGVQQKGQNQFFIAKVRMPYYGGTAESPKLLYDDITVAFPYDEVYGVDKIQTRFLFKGREGDKEEKPSDKEEKTKQSATGNKTDDW